MATRERVRPGDGGGRELEGSWTVERSQVESRDFGRFFGIMFMRLKGIEGIMTEETRLAREARVMIEVRMVAEVFFCWVVRGGSLSEERG